MGRYGPNTFPDTRTGHIFHPFVACSARKDGTLAGRLIYCSSVPFALQ